MKVVILCRGSLQSGGGRLRAAQGGAATPLGHLRLAGTVRLSRVRTPLPQSPAFRMKILEGLAQRRQQATAVSALRYFPRLHGLRGRIHCSAYRAYKLGPLAFVHGAVKRSKKNPERMLPPVVRRAFLAQKSRRQSQWPSARWVFDIQPRLLQHDLQKVLHSRHAKVANGFRQSDKALQALFWRSCRMNY